MNKMTLAVPLAIGSLLLGTTACGKSKALRTAELYQTATCACGDAACVAAAAATFSDHAPDMAKAKSGEADAIMKATLAGAACAAKLSKPTVESRDGAP